MQTWVYACLALAQGFALHAAQPQAAQAGPAKEPFATQAQVTTTDVGDGVVRIQGDSEGGIQKFIIIQKAPAGSIAVAAILIALPSDGSGAFSLQLRLEPPGKANKQSTWDVTEQIAKAVSEGKFPKTLPDKSQLMVQLLKAKGEAVGVPMTAVWKNPQS